MRRIYLVPTVFNDYRRLGIHEECLNDEDIQDEGYEVEGYEIFKAKKDAIKRIISLLQEEMEDISDFIDMRETELD